MVIQRILEIRCPSVKNLHNVLKAAQLRDTAWFSFGTEGITIIVEEVKVLQANLMLKRDMFDLYKVNLPNPPEEVKFRISLSLLCDCLNLFGAASSSVATAMRLEYFGGGGPLQLILEEKGTVANCAIKTIDDSEEPVEFDRSGAGIVAKTICKAQMLRDIFADLDSSSEHIEISISQEKFCFTTFGHSGKISLSYKRDSELFLLFECRDPIVKQNYRLSLLKPLTKAFQMASEVSTRIDTFGFVIFTCNIKWESGGQECFIEFTCAPEVVLEEEVPVDR